MELATIHTETALTREQVDLLKRTVAKGATDDEFALFIQLCKARGLDPFCRQIHFTKQGTITGIDGFRVIAERTGKYLPGDTEYIEDSNGNLIAARVTVRKWHNDQWFDLTETAYYAEYKAGTPIWQRMPRVMLSKCAEARALRRAFPCELSGLYAAEEMDQASHDPHEQPIRPVVVQVAEPPKPAGDGDRLGKCLELFESAGVTRFALENSLGKAVKDWGAHDITSLGIVWESAQKMDQSAPLRDNLNRLLFPDLEPSAEAEEMMGIQEAEAVHVEPTPSPKKAEKGTLTDRIFRAVEMFREYGQDVADLETYIGAPRAEWGETQLEHMRALISYAKKNAGNDSRKLGWELARVLKPGVVDDAPVEIEG